MNRITKVSTIGAIFATLMFAGVLFVQMPNHAFALGSGGGDGGCCGSGGGSPTGGTTSHGYTPPPTPHYYAPTCSLSVSPSQVNYGGDVTISWSTSNATSISLSGWGSVSSSGSQTDSNITGSKTYTLTASGQGGTVTCSKSVTVKTIPQGPVCTLSASNDYIQQGENVHLTWTSSNAVSGTLTQYGSIQLNGSADFYPNTTTTYTATFIGQNNQQVTCSKTVTVDHQHTNTLDCTLKASDKSINRGDSVRISWNSDGADYGYITPDIGDVDDSGSDTVHPRSDTTYKGTFYDNDGNKVTCSVKINVDDYNPPVYPNPTPYINLSAVPYTGLDLGPVGTTLYWAFLAAWCLLAAYLIAVKRIHMSVYRWYKKALFGEEVHIAPAQEVSFAGFSHADVARLAEMLRGAVAPSHASASVAAAPAGDAIDPFILSQIHRSKRS